MARSLPDVRDGLKPVHRRLLYAMRQLRLDPDIGLQEMRPRRRRRDRQVPPARRPVAVYDALVRLAQDFAQRYPLVDGQGNFGNIDGDNAAAMRYTESRLTEVAEALLGRHRRGRRRFPPDLRRRGPRSRSSCRRASPTCWPTARPASPSAWRRAIPPHNAGELCDALLHLIDTRRPHRRRWSTWCRARISRPAACWSSRAKSIARGLRDRPRQLPAARALARSRSCRTGSTRSSSPRSPIRCRRAADRADRRAARRAKKLPLLADVRDESAEDVRIVLEPKTAQRRPPSC